MRDGVLQRIDRSPELSLRQIKERMISAAIGATLVSLVVTPLDVVKVRLQAQTERFVYCGHLFDRVKLCTLCTTQNTHNLHSNRGDHLMQIRGTVDGIMKIARKEGISSLYRGFYPTIIMSLPTTVVYFVGYELLKDQMQLRLGVDEQSSLLPLVSGSVARALAATIVSPLELLKTRMQNSRHDMSVMRQAADVVSMVRASGPSILFRGLVPTLCRDIPFSAIYWTCYEVLKRQIRRQGECGRLEEFSSSFAAGALSGAIAATITIPFDVIKTRQQVYHGSCSSDRTLAGQLQALWREEGMSGITKGIVPRVGKVAPACAIMISSYELGKRIIAEMDDE